MQSGGVNPDETFCTPRQYSSCNCHWCKPGYGAYNALYTPCTSVKTSELNASNLQNTLGGKFPTIFLRNAVYGLSCAIVDSFVEGIWTTFVLDCIPQ